MKQYLEFVENQPAEYCLSVERMAGDGNGALRRQDGGNTKKLLREVVYSGFQTINGYVGGYIFCHESKDETEVVTVNVFESLDAVRAFAGPDYDVPGSSRQRESCLSKLSQLPAMTM